LVYKKYIKRGGKTFGPYYFKSVRDKNGKVKSVYLGSENPSRRSLPTLSLAVLLVLFFVLGTLGFFAYQGFQVAEIVETLSEGTIEDIDIVEEDPIVMLEEDLEIEEEEIIIDEPLSEEEIAEPEIIEEIGGKPIVEINETEIEINSSEENITFEAEIELDSDSSEGNVSFENITPEEIIPELEGIEAEISLSNLGVIINQPVRWEKKINLNKELKDYSVYVPENAFDIKVYDLTGGEEVLIFEEKSEESYNLITGNVVWNFFGGLFGFTGKVIFEEEKSQVVMKESLREFLIKYSTAGPKANETVISNSKKSVIVEGEEFENVLVYSYLGNLPFGSVKVFNKGAIIEAIEKDLDDDGLVDYVEWEILKLDGVDEFEIEIIVLNVQSYPAVGGNWTVEFNTTGIADLRIRPINGTTWSLENESGVDLQFLDVGCGGESLDYMWVNGSVLVENYSCHDIGYEISTVFTDDKHYLEFDFGGQKAYAKNDVLSCGDTISSSGEVVLENDLTGCTGHGIQINAYNVVFNCDGHTIAGDGDTDNYAVYTSYENNVTIKNCLLRNFSNGILITDDDTTIINNTIMNIFDSGVYAYAGARMNITNNTFKDYQEGGSKRGVYRKYFEDSEISNNIFSNMSAGGGLYLDRSGATCSNNRIFGNIITGNRWGIFISECTNTDIYNNTAYDNSEYGIYLYGNNTNHTVRDNIVYTTDGSQNRGIYLANSTVSGDEPTNNTIKNNVIYDHTVEAGIRFVGGRVTGNNITNNTIYGNAYGVYIDQSDKNLIEGNRIYDNTGRGIFFNTGADNNTILNNTVYNSNQASPETDYGIRLDASSGNIIKYNTIKNISGSSDYGIRLYDDGCDYTVIENNTLVDNYYAIWNQGGDYVNISYNNFSSTIASSRGIETDDSGGSNYNRFVNNKFTTTTEAGSTYDHYLRYCYNCTILDYNIEDASDYSLYLRDSSGVNITNFTANDAESYNWYFNYANGTFDQVTLSTSTYGLVFYNSRDAVFKNSVINATSYGVLFYTNADNNQFVDSFLYAPTYGMRELSGSGWKQNILLNTSYNNNILYTSGGTGILDFQYYLDVKVNDTDGGDIQNANVTLFNITGGFVLEDLTESDGWIERQNVTGHYGNYSDRYYGPNNYTINVTHATYGVNTTEVNISDNTVYVVTFDAVVEETNYTPLRNDVSVDLAMVTWVSDNDSDYQTPTSKKKYLNRFAITNDSGTNWYTGFVTKNLSEYSEDLSFHQPQLALNKEGYGVTSGKQGESLLYSTVWDYNYSNGRWFGRDAGILFYTDSNAVPTVDMYNNNSMLVGPNPSESYAPYFSNSSDRGGSWSTWAETNNTFDAEGDFRISAFTYLSNGDGLLVFLDVDSDTYESYRWYADTGVWGYAGEAVNSSFAGTSNSHADVTAYPDGGAYFVWANTSIGDDPIYSRYYDGSSWGTFSVIDSSSNYLMHTRPVVACGAGEVCVAVWPDSSDSLEYAYFEGGVSKPKWSNQNINVGGLWGGAKYKNQSTYSVAVDSSGNAILCYIDNNDYQLKSTKFLWSVKIWQMPKVISSDVNNLSFRGKGTGCDIKLFDNGTNPLEPPANSAPTLSGLKVDDSKVSNAGTQTVNPFSASTPYVSDGDKDILQFVCCVDSDNTCTPTLSANNCSGGSYFDVGAAADYGTMDCDFTVGTTPGTEYVRCAVYDLEDYSTVRNDSYTINSLPDALTAHLEGRGGTNRTHEDLNCSAILSDPDGDTMNVTVIWTNRTLGGSEHMATYTYNYSYPDGTLFNASYPSDGTRWQDTYVCSIGTWDGWDHGVGGATSDEVNISNTPPGAALLLTPTNKNTSVFDRTPLFDWTNSTDIDIEEGGIQTIVYHIFVNRGAFEVGVDLVIDSDTGDGGQEDYYIPSNPLDIDTELYWYIEAGDGYDTNDSEKWNFTIESRLDIVLTQDEVAFGSMAIGANDNTTDKDPPPFIMENQGNVIMDVNLSATDLFSTSGLGNSSFQFKIDNTSEENSFNWLSSITDWTFMPTGMLTAVDSLYYDEANDTAECHFNITVPPFESPGDINSSVTFTSIIAE
jgi:parallel beta-helix repeat protein